MQIVLFVSMWRVQSSFFFFFFQAEDGIRDYKVTGVQTCALPISPDTAADNLTVGSLCRPLTFRVKTAVYSRHEGRPAGGGSKAEPERAARVDRGPVGHARGARPPSYT